jgi:amidase
MTMRDALWRLDATAQAALVGRGDVSAAELVSAALERIERLNPQLNAAVGVDRERSLQRAQALTGGPFAGVPFLVKDLLPQPGLRCAMGSRLFAQHVPAAHVPYTQRIEESGLICLGKSTTSELGLLGSTETLLEGVTRNPWDLTLSAGGSSGGAAAAVACGLVPLAHASDGGGSIRIPASLCGLFGFKPSAGVSAQGAAMPPDLPQLLIDHCVSRSVRDSARFLAVTEDVQRSGGPLGMVTPGASQPLRVGVYRRSLMGHDATPDGDAAVTRAAALCEALGHHVEETLPPAVSGEAISQTFFTVAGAGITRMFDMMAGVIGQSVVEASLEPFTLSLIRWFRTLSGDALAVAAKEIARATASMELLLSQWDVLLCPTTCAPPPPIGFLAPDLPYDVLLRRMEQLAGFTPIHNMAGAPAMSVPLYWRADGLPVGSHFAARRGHDATLLRLAYALEEAAPWSDRWPLLAHASGAAS